MLLSVRPHGPHSQEGGAHQSETNPGKAVFVDLLLVIPPEESAGVSVLRPQTDLQAHLLDVGLQPYTKRAERDDRTQQINLEVRSRLQLAVQRHPVMLRGSIKHHSALPLVAHPLVDGVVG
ncbi:hypothetical protein T06_8129 [Trichinella sp. T6]|nr:hypothetical protein T06_8129 [Trichinella sp. T6]